MQGNYNIVAIRKDAATVYDDVLKSQLESLTNSNILICDHWTKLSPLLVNKLSLLAVHTNMLIESDVSINESIIMLTTLVKFIQNINSVRIAVIIDKSCTRSVIKELRRTAIDGIIPSALDYGNTESYVATNSLLTVGHSWPEHIINELPRDTVKRKMSSAVDKIQLTIRQQQIVDLICKRGLSNKRIASVLNITESTVKIHVSAALKAYGVRTRTQLALSVGAGMKV
jgi:DNA-binding NarL/FixJ family response regulator